MRMIGVVGVGVGVDRVARRGAGLRVVVGEGGSWMVWLRAREAVGVLDTVGLGWQVRLERNIAVLLFINNEYESLSFVLL